VVKGGGEGGGVEGWIGGDGVGGEGVVKGKGEGRAVEEWIGGEGGGGKR